MIKTNLIFIDGIPGSGKSATSQFLCLNLLKQGYQARWIYEQEIPHLIYEPEELNQAIEIGFPGGYIIYEKALSNWKKLVISLKGTEEIIIMDGVLFQTTLGGMLLMGADKAKTIDYVLTVQGIINELKPVFIYLYQRDIARTLRAICDRRGQAFETLFIHKIANTPYGSQHCINSFAGVIEFFQMDRRIMDFLFATLNMPKISTETSLEGNWQDYYKEISAFLAMADMKETTASLEHLTAFVGKYKAIQAQEELVIATDGKGLFIDNLSKTRLIYKAESTFYVEGTHSELSFEMDEANITKKMVYKFDHIHNSVWTRI
jgi:hypothetical protein